MENNILLQKLAHDNVMLLFNDYSIIGTKIYDYLAVKRCIILCYSNDADALKLKESYYTISEEKNLSTHLQADLIHETNSGYVVSDAKHLEETIELLYEEFRKKGSINCDTNNAEKYSRKQQTKLLAEQLKILNVKKDVK
jgi:myosin-crossreactive antigen